jgi:hypothetical protein
MPASWLMIAGFVLLTLLLYLSGVYMLWMPRQCAVLCEVFAASGNFPSLIPRSVRAAVLGIRLIGFFFLSCALLIINQALTPQWDQLILGSASSVPNPSWLIFPSLLAILAGYVLAMEVPPWVVRTLDFWIDHPLVPRQMIPAFPWALRLAGTTLILFGAGVFWFWLGTVVV